ncbi:MAG: GldG family protein, partial [Oscillospiraceae bacterium]|nr:GldG family protein [Oscillospiraceae bacterium]
MENRKYSSVSRPVKLLTAVTAVAVVLAILAVLVLHALPVGSLEFDMTANELYSVTPLTKSKLAALTDFLEVRVFASESSLDEHLVKFLNRYDKLSDKVSVTYIDSVKEPAKMSEYGGEDNSIQVCNTATAAVSSFAISGFEGQDAAALLYDYSYYYMYGQLNLSSFDAEGRLASAIDAVTGAQQRTIYYTTGHGETTMASSLTLLLNKANYRQATVELLTAGGIPEDCDLLIINAP